MTERYLVTAAEIAALAGTGKTHFLNGNARRNNKSLGDEEHAVGPGDFVGYRAGGLAHTMRATGTAPLVCLVIGERLAHDVGDYPRLKKRIYRQAGLPCNLVDHDAIEEPSGGNK